MPTVMSKTGGLSSTLKHLEHWLSVSHSIRNCNVVLAKSHVYSAPGFLWREVIVTGVNMILHFSSADIETEIDVFSIFCFYKD